MILFLGFLAGTFQIGFGFIMITIGSQTTPAAVVGVLMLTESVFGPFWAWLFINEISPIKCAYRRRYYYFFNFVSVFFMARGLVNFIERD